MAQEDQLETSSQELTAEELSQVAGGLCTNEVLPALKSAPLSPAAGVNTQAKIKSGDGSV